MPPRFFVAKEATVLYNTVRIEVTHSQSKV